MFSPRSIIAILLLGFTMPVRAQNPKPSPKPVRPVVPQKLPTAKPTLPTKVAEPPASLVSLPDDWTKTLHWRSIGPATMGGRITAFSVYEADSSLYWVATAGGGLLKTVNNGTTFEHQFDNETTASVGDVCVAPSDPNTVYLGTGEPQPRNSVSYGDGVYKSTDGGKTWANIGLKDSFQIGKIIIDPKDPNTVYVGALGRLYGSNTERGVYKTTDGGKTWQRLLFVNERTGVIDMAMKPDDPNTIIAALWERKRDGFDSNVGKPGTADGYDSYDPVVKYGPGAGLYKTTDGGKNWKKLTVGLPTNPLGRIGLSYYRKNPNTLFAIVDCAEIGRGNPPSKAYAGIRGENTKDNTGATLVEVTAKGPAEKAGLKKGDIVITADQKAVKSYDDLLPILRNRKTGDKLVFTVLRDGKPQDVTVTLEDRPDPTDELRRTNPAAFLLGANVEEKNDQVRIARIRPESAAERAELQTDDLIVKVDGAKVATTDDLTGLLRDKKEDDNLVLTVKRDGKEREIKVALADPADPRKKRPNTFSYFGQQPNVQDGQGANGQEYGGVYRSDDGGESWKRINSINIRPMYFSVVRVDPTDDNYLYVLGVSMYRSKDGGKTFTPDAGDRVHADQHALWIDPKDGRHMLVGCDGGVYASYDRADKWRHLATNAIGQAYHVAFDRKMPYNVYAGYQDNGSWGGPSSSLASVGATNENWLDVGGGDGFVCRVDPTDSDILFTESQGGSIGRYNLRTGERAFVRPRTEKGKKYRFNWNTPFILSAQNPKIFYTAGNYVFRSVNGGTELRTISPEITRTERGTATALSESPLNPDTLWVGSDDGALFVTRDGGVTWKNVVAKVGLPVGRWVATIEASHFAEGRAYVCFDGHRSDDDKPYIYMTDDWGTTWKPITANLPAFGSTRVLREDIKNPDLLLCGTEFAVYASINRGGSWTKINGNLPTVAVFELAIQPDMNELIAATHGRSLWVTDILPLRQMTAKTVSTTTAALLEPNRVIRWRRQQTAGQVGSGGDSKFYAENASRDAQIYLTLAKRAEKVSLVVRDINNTVIRTLVVKNEPGLQMATWDLRRDGSPARRPVAFPNLNRPSRPATTPIAPTAPPVADAESQNTATPAPTARPNSFTATGTAVAAGVYRLVLTVDGQEYTQLLHIENDPNLPADLQTADLENNREEFDAEADEKDEPIRGGID